MVRSLEDGDVGHRRRYVHMFSCSTCSTYRMVILLAFRAMMIAVMFALVLISQYYYRRYFLHEETAPNVWSFRGKSESSLTSLPLHVVYHVGPAKMGSTSIQIGAIDKYQKEIENDLYLIYSYKDASDLNRCLSRNWTECLSNGKEWKHFYEFMKHARRSRRHVLISTENFWSHIVPKPVDFLNAYKDVFHYFNYNVTIVFGYRPLFEYWPSSYYQTYRLYCGYAHKDANIVPPFREFLQKANDPYGLIHPTWGGMQHFSKYFETIQIVPLGPNLVSRFLCNTVVGANKACAAAQKDDTVLSTTHTITYLNETGQRSSEQQPQEQHYNAGHVLALDRLAQAVRSGQLSRKGCKTVRGALRKSLVRTNRILWRDLPVVCLSASQQEWLLRHSLAYQRLLVNYSSEFTLSTMEHTEQFRRAANSTLCDVNVEMVIANWEQYFGNATIRW